MGQSVWKLFWELRRLLSIDNWWEIQVMTLTFHFWATFGGKMGLDTTRAPNSLGLVNPTKMLAHWMDLLGQPLSRNQVFEIIRPEPYTKKPCWKYRKYTKSRCKYRASKRLSREIQRSQFRDTLRVFAYVMSTIWVKVLVWVLVWVITG